MENRFEKYEPMNSFELPIALKGQPLKEGDVIQFEGVNHTVKFDTKNLSFVFVAENGVVINNIPNFLKRTTEESIERIGNENENPDNQSKE